MYNFREQLDKKAKEDFRDNINVIRRNLPTKKDGEISSLYLNKTTQDIADQIARNLVDRALELDRKRLVKKLAKSRRDKELETERSQMLNNFVEVSINRATEQITTEILFEDNMDYKITNFYIHVWTQNKSF